MTTDGYSKVNDRAATPHHFSADWWLDSKLLAIRKTERDTKAGKNITTIRLVKSDTEYSMRPFFNETACYKFPLNKPAGTNLDIFEQLAATSVYGRGYKYWHSTVYKGLVKAPGCPAAGCQRWDYYTASPHADYDDSRSNPHNATPPQPSLREWGRFWIAAPAVGGKAVRGMPVRLYVSYTKTEKQNKKTYTLTSNSTTTFVCGLPGRVSCGMPAAADFTPTVSCADMVGPGDQNRSGRDGGHGSNYLPPGGSWISGFRHHLPPEMGSAPVYSPTIVPPHLLEAVNSAVRIAEVNAEEGLGWRAAAIARWEELSRLDTLSMLRARLSIVPSLKFKPPVIQPQLQPAGSAQLIDPRNVTIPPEFDARKNWPTCISIGTLRNQGNCGACYAMAAVEVLEDRLCIQENYQQSPGKLGETDADAEANAGAPMCPAASAVGSSSSASKCLSAEYVISCDVHDSGCDGGYIDNAWMFLNTVGVPTEACDPYRHCQYPQLKNCTGPNATATLTKPGDALVPPSFLDSSLRPVQQDNVRVLLLDYPDPGFRHCMAWNSLCCASLRSSLQDTCPSTCRDGSEMVKVRAASAYAVGMPGDVIGFQKEIMQHGPVETGM